MRYSTKLSVVALASLAIASACADSPSAPALSPRSANLDVSAKSGGTMLEFNGANANASTALGTVATTQIDNLTMVAKVYFEGPNATGTGQVIFYNGHGGVSGWGILVLGPSDGYVDGTLAILAGGVVVAPTNIVLPRNQWVEIVAERYNAHVTVRIGTQTSDLGNIGVNPVGGVYASIERTSVGGDGVFNAPSGMFHGRIKGVILRRNASFFERWDFIGSGATSKGLYHGTVLNLGGAIWM